MTAFTYTRKSLSQRRSYKHGTFQLQAQSTKQKNPLLELMKNGIGDIESVQNFDANLASDSQDTLASTGVDGNDGDGKDAIDKDINGYTNEITNKITRPPSQNKEPESFPELPPHTALAQVLANQFGIDLTSVAPLARGPGRKITGEDVEYHAWKVSQPPCTEEALELAHSLDLDLNDLYDDEDREYVLQLSEVEMFQENERSLKMSSQTRKGVDYEKVTQSSRNRVKKMSALDKRMEQNMEKLFGKAMKFTGEVLQQVQSQTQMVQLKASEKLREGGVFVKMNAKTTDDIKAVEDFDT
eukprot:CAMPEP_0201918640 /NCGR_PEP_ID=MMETSP0903-20130614/7733_1 /ASSEMBLY_ACC=CAM_ASM_000552 /TAXON_ID=420261 /ORGANISM="Thalassiosira antarctica, Strain CCMP982" /LENGTH=298 /DNA_ID=CAMNT_0048454983 /DNA_START=148 /DNA_END=1040 /DNA_ORIENTATION=+